MFTAILPIRIEENSFWSSDIGMANIDAWLRMIGDNSNVDRVFVVAQDARACHLAEKQDLQVLDLVIPGSIERPYTFDQTIALGKDFQRFYSDPTGHLIVADHRNLLLSAEDFANAMSLYIRHPDRGVISLASCRDHPCQFKAYQTFLGCAIFHVKEASYDNAGLEPEASRLTRILKPSGEDEAGISITVKLDTKGCRIAINCGMPIPDILIAHILPLASDGAVYERFTELKIPGSGDVILEDFGIESLEGIVVTLFKVEPSGDYDTVECFTPENAKWKLGQSQDVIVDGDKGHTIQGRQQFSPVYTYDGSFCIFSLVNLDKKELRDLIPFVLKNSCIVSDWIDYYSID